MRRGAAIASLGIILALYLLRATSSWSPHDFGYLHDDTLYVGSARSLAQGSGYRVQSLPGTPAQTKYPVGYPLVLSLLWRIGGSLGQVLQGALLVNALCGCLFLVGTFRLLGQLGAGRLAALLITLLCSVHPMLVDLARMSLSDLLFVSLSIWTLWFAEQHLGPDKAAASLGWAGAVILGAAAVASRSIGLAVVGGVFMAAALRGLRWQAWTYLAGALPFLGMLGWSALSRQPEAAGQLEGYRQTLLFYTSYSGFWRLSVPDASTLLAQVQFNLVEMLKAPAMLCFHLPVGGFQGGLWQAVAIAISFLIVKGVFRERGPRTWHGVHFALLCHVPIVLLWNYTLMERLLLPFLPLFLLGAVAEGRGIIGRPLVVWRQRMPWGQRIAGTLITVALGALVAYGGYRALWVIPAHTARQTAQRAALSVHKQAAYDWIARQTAPDHRFIAYEDGVLFLHTGRQAMRPIATSTAAFYQQDMAPLEHDLEHLGDTAVAIGARYWLVAEDDYHLESAGEFLREATSDRLKGLPIAFESGNAVRVYDLSAPREVDR